MGSRKLAAVTGTGKAQTAVVSTTLGLLLGGLVFVNCGDTADTDTNPGEKPVAQAPKKPARNAGTILAKLSNDVKKDLPAAVTAQEMALDKLSSQVLTPMRTAWQKGQSGDMAKYVMNDATFSDLSGAIGQPVRSEGGISEMRWRPMDLGGAEAIIKMINAYLAQFKTVEYVAMDIHGVKPQAGHETNMDALDLVMALDVRGITQDGLRRQDRGTMNVSAVSMDNTWRLSKVSLPEVETLTAAKASFAEITESAGLSNIPMYARLEAMRRGGYAITVGDFDNDSNLDLFVGGWGSSNLFRGTPDGKFVDITKDSGLTNLDRVKAAALADLNNDGHKDLALSRFIDGEKDDVLVFMNQGNGTFQKNEKAIIKAQHYDRAMPITVADFNNDGFSDIYVGFPGARDFTYLDSTPNPKTTQGFFLNNGDGTFRDATMESGLNPVGDKAGLAAYPHASVKADFDGDGLVDLMVADDRRGPSLMYKNKGDGKFEEMSGNLGINNYAWAMGIAVGDYDLDGLPDIYMSNIDFLAAKRIDSMVGQDLGMFQGNRLYHNKGNNQFEDVTEKAGVGWAGEAAAGSAWFDYDNDGDLDLYVLNGLWTGPGTNDLSSLFVRAYAAELLAEKKDPEGVRHPMDVDAISLRNPGFNNMIMKSLTDFKGDLNDPTGKDVGDVPTLSLGGHQRNVLFRNNGDGTFTDVGYMAGVDTLDDGYMPAFGDLNKDGKMDLFARACDPGTTQLPYPSLRLYQNVGEEAGKSLAVYLQGDGKKSNRDAVGAKLVAKVGNKTLTREIDTVSGAAQSEMNAFFGLGQSEKVDSLTIHWPSGKVETFDNIPAGRVTIVEGSGQVKTAQR